MNHKVNIRCHNDVTGGRARRKSGECGTMQVQQAGIEEDGDEAEQKTKRISKIIVGG